MQRMNGVTSTTEAAVQFWVQLVLGDIGACAGLDVALDFAPELSVFGNAPDVWVMTKRGRPIGVVEVKKPGPGILDHALVAGQMYDYLKRLRSFYGLKHVFGLATTYAEWRLFWLSDPATEAAALASPPAALSDDGPAVVSGWTGAWWQAELGVPSWHQRDAVPTLPEPEAPPTPVRDRVVRAGPVLDYTDHRAVLDLVASALCKMLQAPTEPPRLVSRQRHYIELSEDSWFWVKLEADFQLKPGAMPAPHAKHLLLLADLRGGVEGRLWLAATVTGAVCVVKFAKDGNARALERERAMWHRLWGRTDVRLQPLGGQTALVMPYVHMATGDDWARPEVVAAARVAAARIAASGFAYTDVHRRHLGLYRDEAGAIQAVFVDLSSVEAREDAAERSLDDMLRALDLAL